MPSARERLVADLQAIPREKRMDWLADLPPDRLAEYRRILPRDDLAKLNRHIEGRIRDARRPTLESWKEDARAGRATSVDAMITVLREVRDRLRPTDAQWIDRIEKTAAGRSYSRKQEATIRGIYARYFRESGAS